MEPPLGPAEGAEHWAQVSELIRLAGIAHRNGQLELTRELFRQAGFVKSAEEMQRHIDRQAQ